MEISLDLLKALRKRSGAGFTAVKEALEFANGDQEKAMMYLREKGMAKNAKRADKVAENGFIASYIHGEGGLGVLVELNSETDFAARDEKFKNLAHDIALQVAATNPEFITIESIPEEVMNRERDIAIKEIDPLKPEEIIEKIVAGKLNKFYEDNVLMEQPFFKDDSKKIKDLVNDVVAALGEKIEVGKFCRFQIKGTATYSTL